MIDAEVKPDIWSAIVQAASAIGTDIYMTFSPDGMSIQQKSADKSSAVYVRVTSAEFEHYSCSEDERLIVLNLGMLTKINKRISRASTVQLHYDENGPDNNLFQLTVSAEESERVFALPLMAAEQESARPLPELDIPIRIQMLRGAMSSILTDLAIVAPRVRFIVESDKELQAMAVGTAGGVQGRVTQRVGQQLIKIDRRDGANVRVAFSINNMLTLVNAMPDGTLSIGLADRLPVVMESGIVTILLAPIIER